MSSECSILIFADTIEGLAELISAGREIVADRITALVIASEYESMAGGIVTRGADEALVVSAPGNVTPSAEAIAVALQKAVEATKPETILIASSRVGADAAATLGQRLNVPCASDCMRLSSEGDRLIVERRVFGGRFISRQVIEGTPRLVTIPPKRFAQSERQDISRGTIRDLAVQLPQPRVRARGTAERSRSDVDITKAEIIVAAGRGVKSREDLDLLEALAKAIGGVVAGSRPLTGDVDWLPVDRRVGLSGQTVKPNLYIACGISGQIEHIVGMKDARTVVAINSDPKAPIHAEADYSIVGDLYEVVPAIAAACDRALRSAPEAGRIEGPASASAKQHA